MEVYFLISVFLKVSLSQNFERGNSLVSFRVPVHGFDPLCASLCL